MRSMLRNRSEPGIRATGQPELSWRADLAWVLSVGVLSRAWVFGVAWLFNEHFGLGRSPLRLLCSWDCGWYQSIAELGYDAQPTDHPLGEANWAFFPLFPLLARAAGWATGWGALAGGLLVANLAFMTGLCVLHRHLRSRLPPEAARFVVVALAFSPYSLYFSAPYTESLYLMLMVCAMHCAHQRSWVWAGLFAAALSATRNLGVFVVLPMALMAVQQFGWRALLRLAPGTERVWLGLALVPLGLFMFMAFLHHHMGDALAFKNVQVAWGGTLGNPLRVIWHAFQNGGLYEQYCAAAACLGLVLGVFLMARGWQPEGLILIIGVLIPAAVRVWSAPRYAFALYPVFVALGVLTQASPRLRWLVLGLLVPPSGFLIASWVAQKTFMI